MFIIIPLILSLNAQTIVPDSIKTISLPSEITHLSQGNWAVRNQRIVGDFSKMSKVIQRAKDAATLLSSPPRIYATSGNSTSLWPDQPGAVETAYGTYGIQPPGEEAFSSKTSMTLTTVVQPSSNPGSYDVIFQSTWTQSNVSQRHAWKFRVNANHQVTFTGEEGDDLPPLPM